MVANQKLMIEAKNKFNTKRSYVSLQFPTKSHFFLYRFMGSHKALGLSVVDFRRTFPPGDAHDAPIALDGPTQVTEIDK